MTTTTTWASVFNDLSSYLEGGPDHALMSCQCVVSEQKANETPNVCPKCRKENVLVLSPLIPLRDIYNEILKRRSAELGSPSRDLVDLVASALGISPCPPLFTASQSPLPSPTGTSLATSTSNLGKLAITPSKSNQYGSSAGPGTLSSAPSFTGSVSSTAVAQTPSTVTNIMSSSPQESDISLTNIPSSGLSPPNLQKTTSPLSFSPNPQRELHYLKCFPVYRKQFMHLTQPRTFLRSHKLNFKSAISPDGSKFVLASTNNKWQLFDIPSDYNSAPVLRYTGTILPSDHDNTMNSSSNHRLFVSAADTYIMFAYDHSIVCYPVWDDDSHGRNSQEPIVPCYSYKSPFTVQCATASPRGAYIAHAILGKDKDQAQRPMIVLHCVDLESRTMEWFQATTVTFTSPYEDPITTLAFSLDDAYLSCSTKLEQRFFVISIIKPNEPRLVMKSARRRIAESDSEQGITSVRFFPGSNRLLSITSCCDNTESPPIILDTKLAGKSMSIGSGQSEKTGSYPQVIMRLDKVGTLIHNCEPSPRKDAVALLDQSGLVYVMHAPNLMSETRKIAVVCVVADATSFHECASMRFTPAGDVLIIVDRKGVCHIQDFAAAFPHQAGVGKCRLLL